jgi:hypothetical protein
MLPSASLRRIARAAQLLALHEPSPLHVASIAHTLLSTHPVGSRMSRSTSSVRSVATPLVFFGHATQTAPAGAAASVSAGHSASSVSRVTWNETTTSSGASSDFCQTAPPTSPSVSAKPGGAWRTVNTDSSPMPSFFGRGVPE